MTETRDIRASKWVSIALPKPLRKRLKAKAAEHGMTPEQAISELISVWVDG